MLWCLCGSTSVFVLISHCAAEFTTVKVVIENALVPVRLHTGERERERDDDDDDLYLLREW